MKFYQICTLADMISVSVIYVLCFFPKWGKSAYQLFVKSCLYVYAVGVLYVTRMIPAFIPIPALNMNISHLHMNLVPYIDLINSRGDFAKQILLNILMFVPFGILYPLIYKKGLKSTVLRGLLFSVCIELLQLVSARQSGSCDITDVINNTLGALVGYLIYRLLGNMAEKVLKALLTDKPVKTFSVSKRTRIVVIVIIGAQIFVRSVMMVFR